MAVIQWIQYTERATAMGHPTREDVVNRPLRQLLANSGISPDADNIVLLTNATEIDWGQIANVPTLIEELGITDVYTVTEIDLLLGAKAEKWVRANVVVTTLSLDDDDVEVGTVALGKSFELYKVVADRHCRVRLYQTAAARTTDEDRPVGTDPATAAGVIADFVFDGDSGLTIVCQPRIPGENQDGPVTSAIYYSIKNESGFASTVQVTFTRVVTET